MIRGSASFFITGGTMGQDTPSYVERQADSELYDGLRQGEFCYVLTARQMGKSSLMVRTASRLREEGLSVVTLDLTMVGQNLTLEQWYYGLLNLTGRQLGLRAELRAFWLEHPELGSLQRFMLSLEQVVLASMSATIAMGSGSDRDSAGLVVFVDEIDSIRSLPFSMDELFAAIRQCYNRRAEEPALSRITFCLLGVASPSQLIQDARMTPFNVGRRIELHDFQEAEARPLAVGLQLGAAGDPLRPPLVAQRLLRRVLFWTHGHPYLTQRLCQEVAENPKVYDVRGVDRICRSLFLTPGARNRDDNLLFVQERLVNRDDDVAGYLDLYRRIRAGQRVRCDETDPHVPELRLSGIVSEEKGYLQVRNRIYRQVFDPAWIDARMPDAELRRQKTAYRQGLRRSVAIASALVTITGGLATWGVWSSLRAQKSEKTTKQLAADRGAALTDVRQLGYVSQIQSAWQFVRTGNYVQALDLLSEYLPAGSAPDLRGWEWYHLRFICQPLRTILRGNSTPITSIAFAPGSDVVLSAGVDQIVRHELESNRSSRHYVPPKAEDRRWMLVAADGKRAIRLRRTAGGPREAGENWELRAVELESGRDQLLAANLPPLSQPALSDNGKLVAAIDHTLPRKLARIWVENGQRSKTLDAGQHATTALCVSRDGRLIATGDARGDIVIWKQATVRPWRRLNCGRRGLKHLIFSPDGNTLIAVNDAVRLFDLRSNSPGRSVSRLGSEVLALALSRDGRWLAVATENRYRPEPRSEIEVWDISTATLNRRIWGHRGRVTAMAFNRDGQLLATGGEDQVARLWDLHASDKTIRETDFHQPIYSLSQVPSSEALAIRFQNEIGITQPGSETPDRRLTAPGSGSLETSATGDALAVITGKSVKVWPDGLLAPAIELSHPNMAASLSFSADGSALATADAAENVRVWNLKNPQLRRTLKGRVAAFGPANELAVLEGSNLSIYLSNGGKDARLQNLWRSERPLTFSPDGHFLAFREEDSVCLVDLKTRRRAILRSQKHMSFLANPHDTWSLAFSPDSRTLASAGPDRFIRLWNVATGKELGYVEGNESGKSVLFRGDADLVVGDRDGKLRVWRGPRMAD